MPKITVLMAVYNGEGVVRDALESILGQTFGDFEFLIVDDGSTDGTREAILSYRDPRIHLIANERNLGLTRSLNRGLALARGEYLARQDADDISEPARFARQVAFLDAHPDVALLGTWFGKIDERGRPIGNRRLPSDSTRLRWCLLFFCPFVHSAAMFRRSAVLERIGAYDESYAYAQDYDLWGRIARVLPVANLAEYLVKVRISRWSMTATYGDRVMEGPRIGVARMAPLLGWSTADGARNLETYHAMHAVLFGSLAELAPRDATRAMAEIFRLVPAFCRQNAMDGRARARLEAEVRSRLLLRTLAMASRYSDEEWAEASALLSDGARLSWPYLLETRVARRSFASLGGQRLAAALGRSRAP